VSSLGAALAARKTWRTLEPLHGMIYFVPEATEAYGALGITGRDGYFASRSAPMGAVSAEVVVATFFNFNPALVHHAIPGAWAITTPDALVAARLEAVDRAFRRILGHDVVESAEMARASELAVSAAVVAAHHSEGRALCAAHCALAWPEAPHLRLWHAQSILREFRGDAHIALLVTHGLSGLDSLITHAATGEIAPELLRSTRGWSEDDWGGAADSLRQRGWLVDHEKLTFSDWGVEQRHDIEDVTDTLSIAPYDAVGDDGCAELRALCRPWSKAFSEVLFR